MKTKGRKITTDEDLAKALVALMPSYAGGLASLAAEMEGGNYYGVRRSPTKHPIAVWCRDALGCQEARLEDNKVFARNGAGEPVEAFLPPMIHVFAQAFDYGAFPTLACTASEFRRWRMEELDGSDPDTW